MRDEFLRHKKKTCGYLCAWRNMYSVDWFVVILFVFTESNLLADALDATTNWCGCFLCIWITHAVPGEGLFTFDVESGVVGSIRNYARTLVLNILFGTWKHFTRWEMEKMQILLTSGELLLNAFTAGINGTLDNRTEQILQKAAWWGRSLSRTAYNWQFKWALPGTAMIQKSLQHANRVKCECKDAYQPFSRSIHLDPRWKHPIIGMFVLILSGKLAVQPA